jgi:hypothetical protein
MYGLEKLVSAFKRIHIYAFGLLKNIPLVSMRCLVTRTGRSLTGVRTNTNKIFIFRKESAHGYHGFTCNLEMTYLKTA